MSRQQEFVDALLDPDRPAPAGLTSWNGSDPAVRFAVYRNNVMSSLVDALADTFPVAQQLVGKPFFRAMARLFVSAELPRSRVLAFYGEAFPAFIEHFAPAATVPYLADVARLEMLRVRAYHAGDAAGLSADAIAQAMSDESSLPDLQIGFHPSLALQRSPYAIVSIWAAHQGDAGMSNIDPSRPENALLIRPGLEVEVVSLNSGASEFVAQLMQGASLGVAAEQATRAHSDFDLTSTLSQLILMQAISSIHTPRSIRK